MGYLTVEILLAIGVLLILVLLGTIFLLPVEKKEKKKKKRLLEESQQQKQELKQKVSKLTKHIRLMRERILTSQKKQKGHDRVLMVEKVKIKKLQEKLSQEREWHKKEENVDDKKGTELRQVKKELGKVQESSSKEHALTIRLERELKGLKGENDSLTEHRRSIEMENARLKGKGEEDRKQVVQLKSQVAELSKKEEDSQWIAKLEYERVARLLEEKKKELHRMEREQERGRESGGKFS